MIRIGLVGAGGMGGVHASCYQKLGVSGLCAITAVADVVRDRAERIACLSDAQVFDNGMDLIASAQVDVVDICLPTYLHTVHGVSAMEKGRHVFVEKPVCLHEEEALRLLETKRKAGVYVAVGHCIRFWEEYVFLKHLIEERTYGQLIFANFRRLSPRPSLDSWFQDEAKSGLAVLDLHIHDVDFVRYVFGQPLELRCMIPPGPRGKEHVASLLQYEGAVVSIEGGWDQAVGFPFEMSYHAVFEEGTAVYSSSAEPKLRVFPAAGGVMTPLFGGEKMESVSTAGGNLPGQGGHFNELRYFLECLSDHKEPAILSLEEGIESARLVWREVEEAERGVNSLQR